MGGGVCEPPKDYNKTVKELEAKLKHEKEKAHKQEEERKEKEAEQQKEREQEEKLWKKKEAAYRKATNKRLRKQEHNAKLRKEEEVRLAEERDKQHKKELADQKRKATEEREALQRLVDAQAAVTKKREEEAVEARRQEEKLRKEVEEKLRRAEEEKIESERREEQARKEAEERRRRAKDEHEAFKRELEAVSKKPKGEIQPIVYPTQEEFDAAKVRVQYSAESLHFAICGPSGSGKSSLINALRGLKPGEPGAAPVGVIETTVKTTRYPDPRTVMPYPRFIWFDVPGAGTFNVPAWKYFNQQGLFIFDFIILVYDAVSSIQVLCAFPSRLLTICAALHADRRGCARKLPALQDPRAHRPVEGDAANRKPVGRPRLQFSRGAQRVHHPDSQGPAGQPR